MGVVEGAAADVGVVSGVLVGAAADDGEEPGVLEATAADDAVDAGAESVAEGVVEDRLSVGGAGDGWEGSEVGLGLEAADAGFDGPDVATVLPSEVGTGEADVAVGDTEGAVSEEA